MNTKKSKVKNFLQSTLVEVSKAIKGLKFNPYHDSSSGRFSVGGGSGGLGSSSGGKESYNDRIEGTQKEADREVKRANKAVEKAKKALSEAESRLPSSKARVLSELKGKYQANQDKIADLLKQREASLKRIEELKSQLKKTASKDLDVELVVLSAIGKQFKTIADELEILAEKAAKL